jgi:hypothetical protein
MLNVVMLAATMFNVVVSDSGNLDTQHNNKKNSILSIKTVKYEGTKC